MLGISDCKYNLKVLKILGYGPPSNNSVAESLIPTNGSRAAIVQEILAYVHHLDPEVNATDREEWINVDIDHKAPFSRITNFVNGQKGSLRKLFSQIYIGDAHVVRPLFSHKSIIAFSISALWCENSV